MRRGFTIVELLMVVGIIAILMGIVTTAASGSIKSNRSQRAKTLCAIVQTGLLTYRAQMGKWPVTIANVQTGNDEEKESSRESDADQVVLTGEQVRKCVKALVDAAREGNPMMDITGLYVSRSDGELSGGKPKPSSGTDFVQAIRGTKQSPLKMKSYEMYFGYPDPPTGYFLRFKMTYSVPSDTISVEPQLDLDR